MFDDVLKIIDKHREFSLNSGLEIKFRNLSEETIKLFIKSSLQLCDWEEASTKIPSDELTLLYTFSEISGWRYAEKGDSYFSEDLHFLFLEMKKRRIECYDINPSCDVDHVLEGMKKCGQSSYAAMMEKCMSEFKAK